ncbi:MAG TPA: hypothetical protein VFS38_01555 [Actinomycetota bacterium]|nr:hypothetical protein [Actinomycetota bacterium]
MVDLSMNLIRASNAIDRLYRRFTRLREVAVVTFASDQALAEFNDRTYREASRYSPTSSGYVSGLYPWEEQALQEHFPPPPAHILVGGAGAGREPLALSDLGYRVTAFEPVLSLVQAMQQQVSARGDIAVACYLGGYEELPFVKSPRSSESIRLSQLGPFDGGILGWGSFSHISNERQRQNTLRHFGELTSGPLLLSFTSTREEGEIPRSGIRSRILKRRHRHPADRFSMSMGFQHPVTEHEIRELARRTGLAVARIDFSHTSLAPHVVLQRSATTNE